MTKNTKKVRKQSTAKARRPKKKPRERRGTSARPTSPRAKRARRPGLPLTAAAPQAVTPSMPADQIAALDLSPVAAAAAAQLVAKHGADIVFTSGRRTMDQQASAMASNVVTQRNWITDVYTETPERDLLQAWVDSHPEATTKSEIAAGLASVMKDWPIERLRKISRHVTGDAFDVKPVAGLVGDAIKKTLAALPHLEKLLLKEGGKIIWHAQFI